jgi:hypothetical protein
MKTIYTYYNAKYIALALATLIFVGVAMYAFMINQAVMNVAYRLDLENSVATLRAETSQLEFTSISLLQNIDIKYARELGFVESNEAHYVVRGKGGRVALSR